MVRKRNNTQTNYSFKYLIFLLLAIFSLASTVRSQNTIVYTPDHQYDYSFGKYSSVLFDTCNCLSVKDVIKSKSSFNNAEDDVINLGIFDNTAWLYFTLYNASPDSNIILNVAYPNINELTLYTVASNGVIDSQYLSQDIKLSARPYRHQYNIFDIIVPEGETREFFLKIKGAGQIIVPLNLNSPHRFVSQISFFALLSGIYFGLMIVMFLYNLFVYFSTREDSYLYYVNYIFWVAITQATLQGFGYKYFWASWPWMNKYMITFTGACVGIASILFVIKFLNLKKHAPLANKLLKFIIFGEVLGIISLFFNNINLSYNIVNGLAGIGSLIVLVAAIITYRKGIREAKFFLISWSIFLSSVIVFVLKDYGVMPYNTLTTYTLQLGSGFAAILLSFALADKINTYKKEKEESSKLALQTLQENERIIREQNIILEAKVNERTLELRASNEELAKTLKDLQEAETQLVESEKMASLGQLTAGIAHEINNPINFVTSNVSPLRRDVDILIDMVNQIEEISLRENISEERRQEIESLKEEVDFAYLKDEMSFLLKGISDGASRTAEIVKGLRVFSRLDEDDLKKADINEGLDSTLVIVNHLLNNIIKVEKNYAGIPLVECFPGKLNQVFLNMMSNAIHAIHERWNEEPQGKLTLTTWSDENNVYVSIKDNGIGMDEDTKKKIFEPFFTTKEVGEGTGLGMSIAYNTIRKHNGSIQINSAIGEGTEFIIILPIVHELAKI